MPASLLHSVAESDNLGIALNPMIAELHYLQEKQLVALAIIGSKPDEDKDYSVKITAKGIDFLTGHIQEVGLASPER
jgi:hypothetical protein